MNAVSHIVALLNHFQVPAFLASQAGDILETNSHFNDVQERDPLWSGTSLTGQGRNALLAQQWLNGVATCAGFKVEVVTSACQPWVMHAAPMTTGEKPAGQTWLVLIQSHKQTPVPAVSADVLDTGNTPAALRSALRAGGMALWEWQVASDEARWSPLVYTFLGLPQGSGIEKGATFVSAIHPDDRHVLDDILAQIKQDGEYAPLKFRVVTPKGDIRWLISCGQGHIDTNGEITMITGVNRDITDEELAEEKLLGAWKEADRRAGILQAVMAHVPIGVAVALEGEEDIHFVSNAGSDLIGTSVQGHREWDAWAVYHLDGLTPALKEEMALHRAARGEVVRDEEWLLRTADGRLLPVRCHAGPVFNDQQALIGGVVTWYDVTPFKEAEVQRQEAMRQESLARQEAEKASEAKDHFLATLSHELRTPLSAMANWTKLLLMDKVDAATVKRGLESIKRNVQVQARLMDDLLDVSRIVAGKFELERVSMDLSDTATFAIEMVRGAADAKQVIIETAMDVDVKVYGDPIRLQQVAWNLITNAIKFSPPSSTVQVKVHRDGDKAILQVVDQGCGIAPENLSSVFERFLQLKNSSNAQTRYGLGLGLAIAQHIVKSHAGEISAFSEGLGQGATFTVTL